MINKILLRISHKIWNQRISSIICIAYEKGIITSEQLHLILSWFDPTQKSCKVYDYGN